MEATSVGSKILVPQRERDFTFELGKSAQTMTCKTLSSDITDRMPQDVFYVEGINAYHIKAAGATVTPESSISLIYKYCEKLPRDKYFTPKPFFECSLKNGFYECKLILPPNAVFQKIEGPMNINYHSAKQLACFEACKKLHQMGALNDCLLSYQEEPLGPYLSGETEGFPLGAGTTKRKELHGTTSAQALSGTWALQTDDITLHAYHLNFSCDIETYNDFVLLTEAKLDDEIAGAKMDLYLIPNKLVKTSVSPFGQVHLKSEQVKKAKLFHEFFFNGIFGKLFVGSKSSNIKREFLFKAENKSAWNTFNMYFLLPVALQCCEIPTINWKGIYSCACVVDFVNHRYSSDKYCSSNCLFCKSYTPKEQSKKSNIIHLANESVEIQNLKDMVVLAIHTGKFYSVIDVELDRSADDPFSMDNKDSSDYTTFANYFHKKYDIVLQHPKQPLLQLKQSHNPHNLLIPMSNCEDTTVEKLQIHAHMPPEILVHVDVSTDVIKAFYLLPSAMHRLESLMLACQLRQKIACCPSNHQIPSYLILEAITSLRCCESFSLERLELLGDSVLKYAVSCHLFLKYPKKHEGELTSLREWHICNSRLYKLGVNSNLQGYIRDSAFEPRRWVAPGQICLLASPCTCGVNTAEVPLDSKYMTEKTSVKVGKPCDRGHRWMCSKTIADCVEALIGAYYVGGGLSAALSLMRWLGINCECELSLIKEAKENASFWCHLPKVADIEAVESKIGYKFDNKGLLLEALTHPSQLDNYCYQRLEYLGDSVLDLLITWHLFESNPVNDPGELTDLRSVAVSNGSFAQAAVRHNLHTHLQHGSTALLGQISEYLNCAECHDSCNLDFLLGNSKAPKVLGDIVESIAGAVLVDTEFELAMVWKIFRQLLSPIVTPDTLELQPQRELIELCSSLGYFIKTNITSKGDDVIARLSVQLNDIRLVRDGRHRNRKTAKAQAALLLLKDLKERGISHAHHVPKVTQHVDKYDQSSTVLDVNTSVLLTDGASSITTNREKQKDVVSKPDWKPRMGLCVEELPQDDDYSMKNCDIKINKPVILSIKVQKGGPRTCLHELCKILQWPLPKFKSMEQKSRLPIIFNVGTSETRTGFNSFTSTITLHIPYSTVISLVGEPQADKKSSQDSAALRMLHELQKQNRCIIKIMQ